MDVWRRNYSPRLPCRPACCLFQYRPRDPGGGSFYRLSTFHKALRISRRSTKARTNSVHLHTLQDRVRTDSVAHSVIELDASQKTRIRCSVYFVFKSSRNYRIMTNLLMIVQKVISISAQTQLNYLFGRILI